MTATTISHPRRPVLPGLALLTAAAAAALSVIAIVSDDVGTRPDVNPEVNVVTPARVDATPARTGAFYVDDCTKAPMRPPRQIAC